MKIFLCFIIIITITLSLANDNSANNINSLSKDDVLQQLKGIQTQLTKSHNKELNQLNEHISNFICEYYSYKGDIIVLSQKSMQDKIGFYKPEINAIYIKNNISTDALVTTLVHELTHYKQMRKTTSTLINDLSYEDEAHRNAMIYYEEFIADLEKDDPELQSTENGWKRMLTGYSFACKNSSQKEFLSAIY